MRQAKNLIAQVAAFAVLFLLYAHNFAVAELHWQATKKEHIRVRLVALASHYPRSSFFSSEEVFVAEKELVEGESRLVKLVYGFLPYQPRLSDQGMEYATVHDLRALRDHNCDEALSQMTKTEKTDNWVQTKRPTENHSPENHVLLYSPVEKDKSFSYSDDSPVVNLDRRRASLPCYVTNAEDYSKGTHQPASPNNRP
jgi:hypothetical protein